MSRCVCGEVELAAVRPDLGEASKLEMAGVLHRSDGPCHDIAADRSFGKHADDCVCMECEDRRAGRMLGETADIGREILTILELDACSRRIEIEAEAPDLVLVTVTTSAYLSVGAGERALIDVLRRYRLVPITDEELEAP